MIMETALAQITGYLPVLLTAIIGLVGIGFATSVIYTLQNMSQKQKKHMLDVFCAGFILMLIIIVAGTGVLVMRDSMREATIIACQKQGMNYTPQQWDNGEVDYSKCNITYVNGIMLNSL
jgi:uncharacterized membrane protein